MRKNEQDGDNNNNNNNKEVSGIKKIFQKHRNKKKDTAAITTTTNSSSSMAGPSSTPSSSLSHSQELKNACSRGSIPFLRPTKTKIKSGSNNSSNNNSFSSSMAATTPSSSSSAAAAAHSEELKNAITSHYHHQGSTPFLRPTKTKLGIDALSPSSVSSSKLGVVPQISPTIYSISKIKNAQQNNPKPKADEFFLEIKKVA
jgi:hypothetical protein